MTNLEINKLIHEKVMGKCLHNYLAYHEVPLYTSSWAFFGPMIEECMKKEWWPDFINFGLIYESKEVIPTLLNPLKGSTALAEFVEANQQCFKGE